MAPCSRQHIVMKVQRDRCAFLTILTPSQHADPVVSGSVRCRRGVNKNLIPQTAELHRRKGAALPCRA
jgi:hypothetical protein